MARNRVLIDTSFLFALYNPQQPKNSEAFDFVNRTKIEIIVPDVVLTEATFLFNRFGGIPATAIFLRDFATISPQLQQITLEDLQRVRQIMLQYQSARFDFVDCCIMALAERLQITQVCTFDRRDFAIFRPLHTDALELLP